VIVADGAPMRNVAPCDSCHGAGYVRVGTPYLDGQPYAYLRAQLYAFTTGTRRNDLREQMRNVARQMTNDEIEAAARHYSSR
jgi:cytochrome c553